MTKVLTKGTEHPAGQFIKQAIQSGLPSRHLAIVIVSWVLCGIFSGLLISEGRPQNGMRIILYIGVISTFALGLYLTLALPPKPIGQKRDDEKPTQSGDAIPPKSNFDKIYLEGATTVSSNGSRGWFA